LQVVEEGGGVVDEGDVVQDDSGSHGQLAYDLNYIFGRQDMLPANLPPLPTLIFIHLLTAPEHQTTSV